MTELPIHEVYAIRYATQPERPEGATFLGGTSPASSAGLAVVCLSGHCTSRHCESKTATIPNTARLSSFAVCTF